MKLFKERDNMINERIAEMLNKQINFEIASSYVYLEMANYFIDEGLDGFGTWFNVQAQEELDHAKLIIAYLQDNDKKISLTDIPAPNKDYKAHKEALDDFLLHEQEITASINEIYAVALEEHDYRSKQFLDWFIEEQGEEEANAIAMIGKYELFGSSEQGLYALDQEYSGRVHTPATIEE